MCSLPRPHKARRLAIHDATEICAASTFTAPRDGQYVSLYRAAVVLLSTGAQECEHKSKPAVRVGGANATSESSRLRLTTMPCNARLAILFRFRGSDFLAIDGGEPRSGSFWPSARGVRPRVACTRNYGTNGLHYSRGLGRELTAR